MTQIIDLNLLVQEPLKIKGTDGETYVIPGDISVDMVLKFWKSDTDAKKMEKSGQIDKLFEFLIEIVAETLNLDKTKSVTPQYVREHFGTIKVLKGVTNILSDHIDKIIKDPNSFSPVSPAKVKG